MTDFTKETHIGDGVYASYDGYQIKLRVERRTSISLNSRHLCNAMVDHEIYLDDRTFTALLSYRAELMAFVQVMRDAQRPT